MKEKAVVQGFSDNLGARNRRGVIWHVFFQASTIVGILALIALMLNIINSAFGYVAYEARVDPDTLTIDGVPLPDQTKEQLVTLLQSNISTGAFNTLERDKLFADRTREEVRQLITERIIRPDIVGVWKLWPSLTQADDIRATVAQENPDAVLEFVSWLTSDFILRPQTSEPLTAGVRTAILGTLWTIPFTVLLALPIGVGPPAGCR
jgi:phosphate transport system permease protein